MPSEIGGLQQLRTLAVRKNQRLQQLPCEIAGQRQLQTLVVSFNPVLKELPREIAGLQQLQTLVLSANSALEELPRGIGDLQQLKTLDLSLSAFTELPKEIWKLEHLEQLILSGTSLTKLSREIGGLKKLKVPELGLCRAALPLELRHLASVMELPECISQAWNNSDMMSALASDEILSFEIISDKGGLVVGAKQMRIPRWIKDHYNDLCLLDIRVCKLEEEGLKILREMPQLGELILRFEVVPRKPIAISGEGFAGLSKLVIDSRVPRVTFQEGAMPKLRDVTFEFQFYGGVPSTEDPLGIKYLVNLAFVTFKCSDSYEASNPCMSATIELARKEAQELTLARSADPLRDERYNAIYFYVCGGESKVIRPSNTGGISEDHACSTGTEEEIHEEKWSIMGQISKRVTSLIRACDSLLPTYLPSYLGLHH